MKNKVFKISWVLLTLLLMFLSWKFAREPSYNLTQKDLVQKTIKEMVKESALK